MVLVLPPGIEKYRQRIARIGFMARQRLRCREISVGGP
jgi:hypothetical protein